MENPTEYNFWGEFEHGVDDKGRVIIPVDFRAALGDEFVVTRGPDRAIWVFPAPIWAQVEAKLRGSVMDRPVGFMQRMLGGRTMVKLDPQSRLAIPKHLRDWGAITPSQNAVIIGQGQKLEIWNKGNWDEYNARFTSENMYDAVEAVGLGEVFNG